MNTYTPDAWAILKFASEDDVVCKVFAGWYGGYTGGDYWKLSSGITSMTEYEDRYEFMNVSGSLYVCYKGATKMTMYLNSIIEVFKGQTAQLQATFEEIEPKSFGECLVYVV